MIKLDYSLTNIQDRIDLVNKILEENPNPSNAYLEILSTYIIVPIEKEERKAQKKKENSVLTENHLSVINDHEISYEGLVSKLENGEDGIYNLMADKTKKLPLKPKKEPITTRDLEEIPPLKDLRDAIAAWEQKAKTATGRDAYIIRKTIIELRQEQYTIRDIFRKPVTAHNVTHSRPMIPLDESYAIDKDGNITTTGVSLCNEKVCSAILCNYNYFKRACYGKFDSDLWYLMEDFDNLYKEVVTDAFPIYDLLVQDKIKGYQNSEIQKDIFDSFGVRHSLEYISILWRHKIPALLAARAQEDLLSWHYLTVEKGKYKKCTRCGQIKLAHNHYFSKNNTSKDGFYSICKECRNKKVVK